MTKRNREGGRDSVEFPVAPSGPKVPLVSGVPRITLSDSVLREMTQADMGRLMQVDDPMPDIMQFNSAPIQNQYIAGPPGPAAGQVPMLSGNGNWVYANVNNIQAPALNVVRARPGAPAGVVFGVQNEHGDVSWVTKQQVNQSEFLMDIALKLGFTPRELSFTPTAAPKEESLLAKILRLYHASMMGDVRSPLVHLVGPPGCGKSTSVEEAADLLGATLHILNVSRMSPLETEGVQMPTKNNTELVMLPATWWQTLRNGDIVLLDEFLRGFAEQYNALLDILTARRVGGFVLPKVFFIAASNSIATYDKALDDRLLHLLVDDPRKKKAEAQRIAKVIIDNIGLMPKMATSYQMEQLLAQEVFPMYELLDQFKRQANVSSGQLKGQSPRKLIGQARLREIQSTPLKELISANNQEAMSAGQPQFVVLPDGKPWNPQYEKRARMLIGNDKLTDIQAQNLELNLQLIEMEDALREVTEEEEAPDVTVS